MVLDGEVRVEQGGAVLDLVEVAGRALDAQAGRHDDAAARRNEAQLARRDVVTGVGLAPACGHAGDALRVEDDLGFDVTLDARLDGGQTANLEVK